MHQLVRSLAAEIELMRTELRSSVSIERKVELRRRLIDDMKQIRSLIIASSVEPFRSSETKESA
jgi:hypothetical protein